MPTFPVRRLGASGIVTDPNPFDLEDSNTFSSGVNVRFSQGKVSRGPVCRTVTDLGDLEPGHVLTIPVSASGSDQIVVASSDFGRIVRINGDELEDLTPDIPGWAPIDTNDRITSTSLGGVAYLNKFTHVPIYKSPGTDRFEPLPGWDPDWRCSRLIAYKDFLIAIGVQQNGQVYPTLVKWSDLAQFGAPPASWDTSAENSAGENIINEMQDAIIDALPLRNSLMLYCTNSVWTMDYLGAEPLFSWRKLFDTQGIMNQNCVVHVENQHFVADDDDIYVHEGASPKSICRGRVRDFIFDSLDLNLKHLCFMSHEPRLSEVRFHYPSNDYLTGFRPSATGCNRCAAYNYSNDTWTFYDTANFTGVTLAAFVRSNSWNDYEGLSWEQVGGAWQSSSGDEAKHTIYTGRSDLDAGLTKPRVYGFDRINDGRLPFPPEPEALRDAFVERVGIDLDNQGKNLRQYIRLLDVWPQMSIEKPEDAYWQFGANDLSGSEPEWSPEIVYHPNGSDFIDLNEAGKYLAYRFRCGGLRDFSLSGFDVTLEPGGRR